MCFINPKFKRTFKLEVCTAHGTLEEFNTELDKQLLKLLNVEIQLNESGKLRWCLTSEYPKVNKKVLNQKTEKKMKVLRTITSKKGWLKLYE